MRFINGSYSLRISRQLVKANRNRLPEVHRTMFVARGNAQQPVAVAQILVAEPEFLRPEQNRNFVSLLRFSRFPRSQMFVDRAPAFLQKFERLADFTSSDRR